VKNHYITGGGGCQAEVLYGSNNTFLSKADIPTYKKKLSGVYFFVVNFHQSYLGTLGHLDSSAF